MKHVVVNQILFSGHGIHEPCQYGTALVCTRSGAGDKQQNHCAFLSASRSLSLSRTP